MLPAAGAALLWMVVAAGCDQALLVPQPTADIDAQPPLVCPGEIVEVTWNGGAREPIRDCEEYDVCREGRVTSIPNVLSSNTLNGTASVAVDGRTGFTFDVQQGDESAHDSAEVDVIGPGGYGYTLVYTQVCSIFNRWAWVRQQSGWDDRTDCMVIREVCSTTRQDIRVTSDSGASAVLGWFDCTPVFNGTTDELTARPTVTLNPDLTCDSRTSDTIGPDGTISINVVVGCPGPGEPAPAGCVLSTSAPITSEPGGDEGIVPLCDLDTTCGDGQCDDDLCEDATNCAEDCAPADQNEAVCGDGVLGGEEQCEEDKQCQPGYSCGQPGTNAPCLCVPISAPQAGQSQPGQGEGGICDGAAKVETYPVYDCTFASGTTFTYYEGMRCWDADGKQIFDGRVSGPYTSTEWLPGCPSVGGTGEGGDNGPAPCYQKPCP